MFIISSWRARMTKRMLEMPEESVISEIFDNYELCEVCYDEIVKSKGLDIILNYPIEFKLDAVIYDFTCGLCLLPLLSRFHYPPLISVTPRKNPPNIRHLTGGQSTTPK